jgi:proline iminopeptidase
VSLEGFVDSDGARLWTTVQGDGPPTVVLCSGGPGCCDYLAPAAAMLDGAARVVRWEQRGCGRSGGGPPYTLDQCLSDLEAIRKHYGAERWVVAGHSWGADLALFYALHHPERTLGVVCIAGGRVHNDREWHQAYERGRDAGIETLPEFDYPPNLEVNRQLNAEWKRYIQRPTLFREIARLDRPTLFLYGDQDIRPGWPVEQVANLLPNAHFERIEGADHHPWVTHSDALARALHNFVSSLPAEQP